MGEHKLTTMFYSFISCIGLCYMYFFVICICILNEYGLWFTLVHLEDNCIESNIP